MGFHTYPIERAPELEDASRYRYLSREELVAMLAPAGDELVADLGSGTGFYTDDVAPFVERTYAVDLQPEMHALYREKGVPENVTLVTCGVADMPFDDGTLDAAVTTMTYHEFYDPDALEEVRRVLVPGGRFVVADWSRNGSGEDGPPTEERYDLAAARDHLEGAGFAVERAEERPETFVVVVER